MRPIRLGIIPLLFFLVACSPAPTATPIATPSPIPTATIQFDGALGANFKSDLALLDRPTRYDLTLTYDPASTTLSGSQEVQYTNASASPLSEIYFRLFANYPDSGGKITVVKLTAGGQPIAPAFEAESTALRVDLGHPLAPGATLALHLEYIVSVPKTSRQHYADFSADESIVTLPTVFPLIPAFDSRGWHIEMPPAYGDLVYADASLFAVTMTAPLTMTLISSGSVESTADNANGTRTWKTVGAPMRDYDLNLTSRLNKASLKVGEVTVNSYYEPAHEASGKDALKYAADALGVYERRFGAYPYKKLDVVETPTTAGGIEYPTVVVISRNLYNNPKQTQFFEFAVAHEVSHQWWYGVVGDDQVNFPWVDEALAQYSALIYEEEMHGSAAARSVLRDTFQGMYNQAKKAGHDAAVNQPVAAFDEADYGAIVYGKGPLFYDAIRQRMGDARFFEFLQRYYRQYRYKIAMPEDILQVAEATFGGDLHDLYQQWILSPPNK